MLYQQGTQRIEVVVTKDTTSSSAGANTTSSSNVTGSNNGNETSASSSKTIQSGIFAGMSEARAERTIITNVTHTVATTKQISNLALQYVYTDIGYMFGDQALQQNVARQIEIVEDITAMASSVVMGAVYGSRGGVLGIAVGTTAAVASTTASLISKYATRERDNKWEVFKENNSIQYQRARANINMTTGRLR